jgi:hypothetical protein
LRTSSFSVVQGVLSPGADDPGGDFTPSVALVRITLVSEPKSLCLRYAATSTGAAFRERLRWVFPVRSTQYT